MPMMASSSRRTRIVCISDTHNCTVKLPEGDVLIHAGDLTNQGSYSELSRAVKWLEDAKFEAKIVIAGNHDITLDEPFYSEHGLYFHNQNPQSHADCLSLLKASPYITYLDHSAATISLRSPSGPHTRFTVFGSPYSPRNGLWAFGYDAPQSPSAVSDLPSLWDNIPMNTDIVVTHTPAHTHRDETGSRRAAGCEALRRALWRVRPLLAVSGHVHESRGSERVVWDLASRNVAFAERGVTPWTDPGAGNNKISLVDLTGRKAPRLDNNGSNIVSANTASDKYLSATPGDGDIIGTQACRGSQGLGGEPPTRRGDWDALAGRTGRKETCIVNAAIMRKSYPHVGGKELNKPIVVDLDLPVWTE